MKGKEKIRWKHFIDKRGVKIKETLMNGSEMCRTLTDVFFEIKIMDDGTLDIKIEDEQSPFYSKKRKTLYSAVYDKVYKFCKTKDFAFYNETTHTYCKIVEKTYSTISNSNW